MNTSVCDVAMSGRECVNLSDLSEDELADLATRDCDFDGAHLEHYLVIRPDGRLSIRPALANDIRSAVAAGDVSRSGSLKQILLRFMQIYTARA